MDIRVLQYFLAVAREGSITRAAEVLRMTQPPLSRQLRDLEEELGKTLFLRGSKRVTLTEEGMLLRKRAEEMIDLLEKTRAELAGSHETVSGEIYIGGGESGAFSLFARAAGKLRQKYPNVHYHVYSGDAGTVTEKLDKGLIDFGLLVGPVDVSKYGYMRLPVSDTWGILMRKDSPLARGDHVRAEDLWDKPLIMPQQTYSRGDIFAWLRRDVHRLHVAMSYNLIYNASHFVGAGFGYAVTLDGLVNTTGDSPLCFRPLYPRLEAGLCIAWKKSQVFSRASWEFLCQLRKEWETDTGPARLEEGAT